MNSFVSCILFVAMMAASSIWCATVIRRVAEMKIKVCFALISFGVSLLSLINLLKCSVTPDTVLQTVLTAFYALPTIIILICAIVLAVAITRACKGRFLPTMPVVLIGVMMIYSVLYVLGVPFISGSPLNIINGALLILICESCISPRLFKTGEDYRKMFEGSSISAVITDEDMNVAYRTRALMPDSDSLGSAIENGIEYKPNDDFILTAQKVDGGFAVFTKEIKELNMLLDELNETSQQLQKSNELIAREEDIRKDLKNAELLNKLYDDTVNACVGKLSCVSAIVRSLPNDKFARNNMLLKAKLLTSYVKSKFEMLTCIESSKRIAPEVFLASVQEISEVISGIVTVCDIAIDSLPELDSRITMLIFDWLENLCEFVALFPTATIKVQLLDSPKAVLLNIVIDGLDAHKKFEADKALMRKTAAYNGRTVLDVFSSKVGVKVQLPTEVM